MYSPAPTANAPATSAATPVSTTACDDAPPPPSPEISDAFVTRPSTAPNTVGRSHPPDTSRWPGHQPPASAAVPLVCDGWRISSSGTCQILPQSSSSKTPAALRYPAAEDRACLQPDPRGAAILGLVRGDVWLAVGAASLGGACLGFLLRNICLPARIFLGDGGSMPLGFAAAVLGVGSEEHTSE